MTAQDKAQKLLDEWHRFRNSGACAFIFEIQERKDRLESMAASLSAGLYCDEADNLSSVCNRFEIELDKLRQSVYGDLLAGLQKPDAK